MAEPVRVRRPTDQEGQKLQQIVRRGSTNPVRYRRAMLLPASAGGNRVPVIAQLVQADEDTVRDVIHRFNETGLTCLDPQWAGGRPRRLNRDDEDFVVETATTRPTRPGRLFARWSLRNLVAHLRTVHGRVIRIGTGIRRWAKKCRTVVVLVPDGATTVSRASSLSSDGGSSGREVTVSLQCRADDANTPRSVVGTAIEGDGRSLAITP